MNGSQKLILVGAIAAAMIASGCSHQKNGKKAPTTQPTKMSVAKTKATTRPTEANAVAPAPAVPSNALAGEWSLAIPRRGQQQAKITVKDDTHVTIQAGENLSGEFVIQGNYLLILTRDEKLRPLAWRINSADSLTVVRSPELGDYTGVTLVRAPSAADAAAEDADAEAAAISGEFLH